MNIKENIFIRVREYMKKYLTGNLGEVIEYEDKLICYIDKKTASKKTINCSGIKIEQKELVASYNLNKPIIYVFESLNFYQPVNIFADNCDVYIRDCVFDNNHTYIRVDGNCFIEGTDFKPHKSLFISAQKLKFRDLYFNDKDLYTPNLDIYLGAVNELNIDNCTFIKEKNGTFNITGNEITLKNAIINHLDLNIECENIIYEGNNTVNGETQSNPLNKIKIIKRRNNEY